MLVVFAWEVAFDTWNLLIDWGQLMEIQSISDLYYSGTWNLLGLGGSGCLAGLFASLLLLHSSFAIRYYSSLSSNLDDSPCE